MAISPDQFELRENPSPLNNAFLIFKSAVMYETNYSKQLEAARLFIHETLWQLHHTGVEYVQIWIDPSKLSSNNKRIDAMPFSRIVPTPVVNLHEQEQRAVYTGDFPTMSK